MSNLFQNLHLELPELITYQNDLVELFFALQTSKEQKKQKGEKKKNKKTYMNDFFAE